MCDGILGMIEEVRKEGIQECMKEGIEEGIKEGELKAKREMAAALYADGTSLEKIAHLTKVNIGLVQEWLFPMAAPL